MDAGRAYVILELLQKCTKKGELDSERVDITAKYVFKSFRMSPCLIRR